MTSEGQALRILLVSRFFWPSPGGHTTVLRDLARAWVEGGHSVVILTTRHDPDLARQEELDGARVIRFDCVQTDYATIVDLLWRLRRFFRTRSDEFDVVCVSMLKHCALAAVRHARPRGLPVVLRTEGGGATGDVAWQETARFGAYIRRRCQEADTVVALTSEIEDELERAHYPMQRVRRIGNGVRIPTRAWSSAELSSVRRSEGLDDRETICFTGRLIRQKGLLELVEAVSLLRSRGRDLQLLLVGDGRDRDEIERFSREKGVDDRTIITGQIPDVETYLRASDLFVLPSYHEGMSRSALESLALGAPTLASDIEANRQLAPPSILPVCPPKDPQRLADSIEAQLQVAQNSSDAAVEARRTYVSERFGIERIAGEYIHLFERLRSGLSHGANA